MVTISSNRGNLCIICPCLIIKVLLFLSCSMAISIFIALSVTMRAMRSSVSALRFRRSYLLLFLTSMAGNITTLFSAPWGISLALAQAQTGRASSILAPTPRFCPPQTPPR